MALYYLPKIELGWDLLLPASVAWIAFGLSYLLFTFLGKMYGWSKKLIGCLIITAGLGNTSFVGIPVIQALYGEEARSEERRVGKECGARGTTDHGEKI